MVEVVRSGTFDRWFRQLKDRRAVARVLVRINRLAAGNPGDVKPVGQGVSELRIPYGPGYRIYYLLDALAADAGLRLDHRTADWPGAPFTPAATAHVSRYRLA